MPEPLMPTYPRLPVVFQRGAGCWLYDTYGTSYLDAVAGIAVCGLGHAHPTVTEALCHQAGQLVHTSNLYEVELQTELARRLTAATGMEQAFFCNSGAEANEAAIKLARKYGHERGIGMPRILVAEGAFHGRTLATLTATHSRRAQAGFEPLMPGFVRIPYDDLDAVARLGRNDLGTVAVLVEPIQGEGGVRIPDPAYLAGLRELCDRNGWLLMVDEVQSGVGRTGTWLATQGQGVVPDVVTLAKALGNGVPIGACLARGPATDVLGPGSHGTTFGGSPLAARAALAVLDTLEAEDLPARAAATGEWLLDGLRNRLGDRPDVVDIRGRGLMIGIELDQPCTDLPRRALAHRLLANVTAERVVRLLPPLILSDAEAMQLADLVGGVVGEHLDA